MLRLTLRHVEPPNDYWKPFDISFARVINTNPYGWIIRQYASKKFVSTDFIVHFGFGAGAKELEGLEGTVFVHGKEGSGAFVAFNRDLWGNAADLGWWLSAGDLTYREKFDLQGRPKLRDVPQEENTGAIRRSHNVCVIVPVFGDVK